MSDNFYRETIGEEAYRQEKAFDRQIDQNNQAHEFEHEGKIEEAICLYEKVLVGPLAGLAGDRLVIIYRRRKQYQEEIRVLERVIEVYEHNIKTKGWNPPIEKTRLRLDKTRLSRQRLRLGENNDRKRLVGRALSMTDLKC